MRDTGSLRDYFFHCKTLPFINQHTSELLFQQCWTWTMRLVLWLLQILRSMAVLIIIIDQHLLKRLLLGVSATMCLLYACQLRYSDSIMFIPFFGCITICSSKSYPIIALCEQCYCAKASSIYKSTILQVIYLIDQTSHHSTLQYYAMVQYWNSLPYLICRIPTSDLFINNWRLNFFFNLAYI